MSIPTAELHVHLEGTATPDLVRRIAARNGLEVPEGVFAAPDRFAWRDFLDFLNTYNMAASVIRTGEDYRDIAYEYLAGCARDGTIYVELTASVDHARLAGLSDAEHWEGIAAGIDDARRDHGIEARILSVAVRNFGVERAIEIAEHTAARPHPYVVGFSLAGDEAGYPPEPYLEAYRIVAAAGLGCTVHAGEWARSRIPRSWPSSPAARSRWRCAPRATWYSECSRVSRSTPSPSCAKPGFPSRSAPTTRRTSGPASRASTRSPASTSVWATTSSSASPARPSKPASPSPHCATSF
jgi:hypothetical protein